MSDLRDRQLGLWSADEPVAVQSIGRSECNDLLTAWRHPLGPCNRPFGQDHWLLYALDRPVALAVSASIVSPTIRDEANVEWPRNKVVELARIARAPSSPWAMRVMLRLWREALAPLWSHWTPELLASYSLPGTPGDIYRFDGWIKARDVKQSKPGKGSTWAKPSASDEIADGRKGLWFWHPEMTTRGEQA